MDVYYLFLFLANFMFKKIKNKKIKLAIFCGVLAILLAGYFFWFRPKYQANSAKPAAYVAEVTVIKITKQSTQLFTELPGRVEAYKISEVRPQIDGVIKKIKFVEGSFVKQGQQLYQIDPTVYQIAFDNANANLKTVRAKKERYANLIEQDAISRQEFDDIVAAFGQAQAEVRRAQTNLNYTKVYAPISGYIGKSNLTEGALVTTNQAGVLTTITQLDPIYVDLVQASKDAIQLGDQKNIAVTLTTDDASYQNSGTLKFSEVFADESTDSVRLRTIFLNKDKKLIPGMFVTAKLHLKSFDAILVPQRAASRGADGNLSVWVVDQNNIAKMRAIKANQISGDSWIVEDGINDGDTIIYEGFQKIADGAKVNPVPLVTQAKNAEVKTEVKK